MKRTGTLVAGLIAAATLIGCGAAGSDEADGGASLACRDFRQTANDYDRLTRTELRDRLKDVDGNAQLSEEPGVATSARAMIVAITSGTDTQLVEAVESMLIACQQAGE